MVARVEFVGSLKFKEHIEGAEGSPKWYCYAKKTGRFLGTIQKRDGLYVFSRKNPGQIAGADEAFISQRQEKHIRSFLARLS